MKNTDRTSSLANTGFGLGCLRAGVCIVALFLVARVSGAILYSGVLDHSFVLNSTQYWDADQSGGAMLGADGIECPGADYAISFFRTESDGIALGMIVGGNTQPGVYSFVAVDSSPYIPAVFPRDSEISNVSGRGWGAIALVNAPIDYGFIGLRIGKIDAEDNVSYTFGWARISGTMASNGVDLDSLVLHDFAFETSGSPIAAGQIPEPSSYAVVFGLLAGVAAYRKRRIKPVG